MSIWTTHALRRLFKAAMEDGFPLQFADEPERRKPTPDWSMVGSSIDPEKIGCVSVILPWWLSTVWLRWKLPQESFKRLHALRRSARR